MVRPHEVFTLVGKAASLVLAAGSVVDATAEGLSDEFTIDKGTEFASAVESILLVWG